jgi:hypothetical protein
MFGAVCIIITIVILAVIVEEARQDGEDARYGGGSEGFRSRAQGHRGRDERCLSPIPTRAGSEEPS